MKGQVIEKGCSKFLFAERFSNEIRGRFLFQMLHGLMSGRLTGRKLKF